MRYMSPFAFMWQIVAKVGKEINKDMRADFVVSSVLKIASDKSSFMNGDCMKHFKLIFVSCVKTLA